MISAKKYLERMSPKGDWIWRRQQAIDDCMLTAPIGSGFDTDIILEYSLSNDNALVFLCGFHPLHEDGYYMSWEYYRVILSGDLLGTMIKSEPVDSFDTAKGYVEDCMYEWLNSEYQGVDHV